MAAGQPSEADQDQLRFLKGKMEGDGCKAEEDGWLFARSDFALHAISAFVACCSEAV